MTKLMNLAFCLYLVFQLSGCATETMVIGHARGSGSHYTQAPYDMEYSLWSYTFLAAKEDKIDSVVLNKGEIIGFMQQDVDTVIAVAGKYQKQMEDRWYIWFRPTTAKEKALDAILSPLNIFKK